MASSEPDPGSPTVPDADRGAVSPGSGSSSPASPHGRAGRDLPAAIGVGVGVGAFVVLSLLFLHWGFVIFMAVALVLAAVEVHQALHRHGGMRSAIVPIVVGTVAIVIGSYLAGLGVGPLGSDTVLLAAVGLTVIAALVWRMPGGAKNYVADSAASLFIIGYIPLLGSFASLMLAGSQGGWRVIAYALVVVMGDLGGYVFGVLMGRHPMAPRISPKKSWEGLVGSFVFGIAAGIAICMLLLHTAWWVGLVLGVVLVAVGVCGDLIESLIKRDVGIKDMSSFLPGHGGVMDRLDSLLVTAPTAWFVLYLLVPGG